MKIFAAVPALALLALSSCAPKAEGAPAASQPARADVSAFAATGEPRRCLNQMGLGAVQPAGPGHVMVRDGSKWYRNELRGSCPWFDWNSIPVMRNAGPQMCELDSFQVIDRSSRMPMGICVLGKFTPVDVPDGAKF